MSVGVFSPDAFDIIISKPSLGFSHVLTGYANGTGVSLTPYADRQSPYLGVKGDFSLVRHPSKAYNLVAHLAQTSRSNDILLQLQNKLREGYDPTFEVTVIDRSSGTTTIFDKDAVMTTEAEWSVADDIGTRDWTIVLPHPQGTVGGNGTFSVADEASYNILGGTVPDTFKTK